DQAAAVCGVLTSGAQVEVLMAAAGTGKSFVVGAIADAWRHGDPTDHPTENPDSPQAGEPGEGGTDRRVFGLAPYQVAADILPGGAPADAAERGTVHHLTGVRRFTNPWEGPASLRLRDGDPTVLDEYAKHGRFVDGGTAEQAETAAARGYLADALTGKHSLLM